MLNNFCRETLANVADSREAKSDLAHLAVEYWFEIDTRKIDIGCEHNDVVHACVRQIDGRLLIIALDAGEQTRKILDRKMRFKIRGLIRN